MRVLCALLLITISASAATKKFDLLVQGAVDSEIQPLLKALEDKKQIDIGAWTFWTGRIGRKSVVLSRTEMGPINAAAATMLAIEQFHPASIINQGTAGAHNPDFLIWDIVLGAQTTDYGAFKSEHADAGGGTDPSRWKPMAHLMRLDNEHLTRFEHFQGDPNLLAAAKKIKYERGALREGNIGSAYEFNKEIDRILWLHKTYGTDSEDMESAFAAGVGQGMKIPVLAIRIISDSEMTHPKFEEIAGEYCAQFVLDLIRSLK